MSSIKYSASVHRAFAAVQDALDGLGLEPDDLVLVACSGGADSLALAVAVAQAAKRVGRTTRRKGYCIRAGAVIVDHNLHPDSAAVATKTAAYCQQLGLDPVIIAAVAVDTTSGEGLEAAARTARYEAFEQASRETGAKAILLGHTMDDQAESVLLGLARGSGARSLSGIAPQRGKYLRPFLEVRRRTTEEICNIFGLEPWHDPANYLPQGHDICGQKAPQNHDHVADAKPPVPTRTNIRATAIPALSAAVGHDIVPALARTADLLREDADALKQYATDIYEKAQKAASTTTAEQANLALDIGVLNEAPAAVRTRALRLAMEHLGIRSDRATRAVTLALDALVTNWHGQDGVYLPRNLVARRIGGILRFDLSEHVAAQTQRAPDRHSHRTGTAVEIPERDG